MTKENKNLKVYKEELRQRITEIARGVSSERLENTAPTLKKYVNFEECEVYQEAFEKGILSCLENFWTSYNVQEKLAELEKLEKNPELVLESDLINLQLKPMSVRYYYLIQRRNELQALLNDEGTQNLDLKKQVTEMTNSLKKQMRQMRAMESTIANRISELRQYHKRNDIT